MDTSQIVETIATIVSIILGFVGISVYINRLISKQFDKQIGNARKRARENRLIFETMLLLIKAVRGDQVNGELADVEIRIQNYLFGLIDDYDDEDKK